MKSGACRKPSRPTRIIRSNRAKELHRENQLGEKLRQNVHQLAESLGNLFVETFHYLALFAIVR